MKNHINFVTKLGRKRTVRKATSGLWTKYPRFHDTIVMNIIHRRTKIRKINKHIDTWKRPWGLNIKELSPHMYMFYKMYSRRKERVKYGKDRR